MATLNPSPLDSVRRSSIRAENWHPFNLPGTFHGGAQMHASPVVIDLLRLARMRCWLSIIRQPCLSRKHTTAEARRNYLKLVRRHRALAAAHKLTEQAAFESDT